MTHAASPVLLVGSMAFDDLELPSVNAKDVVGGSATYASYAASVFAPVRPVAVVGEDFPEATLAALASRGVDVSGVERAKGKTFRWAGRYDAVLASRVTLDTQLNVFADFRPKISPAHRATPFVMLGNIHPALQLDVLGQIEKPALVIADTMNLWIDTEPKLLGELLSRIDLLVINEEEARQLSGQHNISRAAREIRSRGPAQVIIKRGEYGAVLFDGDSTFFAPAYPLEDVVDPTGAGDTFAGALLGFLASGGALSPALLRHAIVVASCTASFCVEGVGTAALQTLTRRQIAERLEHFRKLMYFPEVPA